jgi:hypothetical protein
MRRLLLAALATGMLAAGLAPVPPAVASPYDTVLPPDFVLTGPVEDLINLLNEILGPGKREWVTHDPTRAVGEYTITQGANGRLVSVGVGDLLLAATPVREQAVQGRLVEFRLVLQVAGSGPDVSRDLDGDGDADVVWTHASLVGQ